MPPRAATSPKRRSSPSPPISRGTAPNVVWTCPTPTFTPQHRWSTKNNAICGICLDAWVELLYRYRKHVEWRTYWFRVLFVTFIAAFNTCLAAVEWLLYSRAVKKQVVHPRPLFVLGHPRTGTTLLHNLLSKDVENFGFCSTFCAGFPSSFLWFEPFKWMLAGMVDKKRPMDDMELSLDVPQEDELAVSVLSAGISPYMPLTFMTAEPSFRPFFTFKDVQPHQRQRWIDCFSHMLRKLSYRCGGKRLLLKSPVHTARVKLLLELYPDAQFIYIHRHPEQVYQSACHMANTVYWYMYLATPTDEQIHEFILNQFVVLWREYDAARKLIPKGNLVEVAYSDLAKDPVETIARIYSKLSIDGFDERMRARVVAACERPQVKGHKVNKLGKLPDDLKAHVAERWADYCEAWGYEWK